MNGQPKTSCDLLHAPFCILLLKKGDEVIEGQFFFNSKAGDQLIQSIGNVIIAQSLKHVSGTFPHYGSQRHGSLAAGISST